MDKNRIVAGLDVHKDTIYLCVLDSSETVIFANVYGTLTPDLQLMCSDMVSHGVMLKTEHIRSFVSSLSRILYAENKSTYHTTWQERVKI